MGLRLEAFPPTAEEAQGPLQLLRLGQSLPRRPVALPQLGQVGEGPLQLSSLPLDLAEIPLGLAESPGLLLAPTGAEGGGHPAAEGIQIVAAPQDAAELAEEELFVVGRQEGLEVEAVMAELLAGREGRSGDLAPVAGPLHVPAAARHRPGRFLPAERGAKIQIGRSLPAVGEKPGQGTDEAALARSVGPDDEIASPFKVVEDKGRDEAGEADDLQLRQPHLPSSSCAARASRRTSP